MSRLSLLWGLLCVLLLSSCRQPSPSSAAPSSSASQENLEAKALLQGVWQDSQTEEVLLKAEGDTIFFADGTGLPAYFRIVGDSIELGSDTYRIVRQTAHNFWFQNHAGDEVRLVKSDEEAEAPADFIAEQPQVMATTEAVSLDSVVFLGGQRYHWYITVNPTRNRVQRTSYTPEGVAVENVYYDNIIHLSVFKGNERLFTRDFRKQAYADNVPDDFLSQSVLGNIRYGKTDERGFHFYATVCIPDGEQCYMIETIVSPDGKLSTRLME